MTPATCIFHQAAEIGIKPMDFIDIIVELGCEAHKKVVTKKPNSSEQLTKIFAKTKERELEAK